MAQEAGSARRVPNVSNLLQIRYKTVHSGASGRLIAQEARSARSFPNATNPLHILYQTEHSGASGASRLRRPDLPDPSQMLQILYKSFSKRSILEPLALRGSGSRICQILPKCFKSFTIPLQNSAFCSLWRLMAQEAGFARSFPNTYQHTHVIHSLLRTFFYLLFHISVCLVFATNPPSALLH